MGIYYQDEENFQIVRRTKLMKTKYRVRSFYCNKSKPFESQS